MDLVPEQVSDILRVLAAILHIGNITFVSAAGAQIATKSGVCVCVCVCMCVCVCVCVIAISVSSIGMDIKVQCTVASFPCRGLGTRLNVQGEV